MTIESISISVFDLPGNTPRFGLEERTQGAHRRWEQVGQKRDREHIHVLHVCTDEGVEGVCTVGDARYTTMRTEDLEQLRFLALGEDPFDRERLNDKLRMATRSMFTRPGWFGAFDNCLWDIAGIVAGLPVYALIGRARSRCPAYYNIGGRTIEISVEDARQAVAQGFRAVKDHFQGTGDENAVWCRAVREALDPDIDLMHDAAWCQYSFEEAVRLGRNLYDLRFRWFEEPLADRDQTALRRLCEILDIPVLAPETLMHDRDLSALWLVTGAADILRGNARHGTTPLLKLSHLAELHGASLELNGPGGLFGLVHAHLVCAIQNTSYYEYFPGGSRDEIGREIGLMNSPLPEGGYIEPPDTPGWGAEWDQAYFMRHRIAEL